MKKWVPKQLLRKVGVCFVALLFLSMFTSEYVGKLKLRRHAETGTSFSDFKAEYGEPRYTYRNWEALPQDYQQLFIKSRRSENTYYSYQREGLPSYWSFVVSVDSGTQTIQRYIYWKAIALKPKDSI